MVVTGRFGYFPAGFFIFMEIRKHPYLKLYVQDFLTDEKLIECSASATGVYIRMICVMHKSETYGRILLKQTDKQTDKQILNFALKLTRYLPYTNQEIESALNELLAFDVIQIDGDSLVQKRMLRDYKISEIRALAGSQGGKSTQGKKTKSPKNFAKAKIQANSEYENEYENENKNDLIEGGMGGDFETQKKYFLNDDAWKYKLCSAKNISKNEIEQLMEMFITDIELKQDYKSNKELKSHFTNWFNLKKKEYEKRNFNQYSKQARGAQQLLELIKQERASGL